jgi:hypothetical protein
MLVGLNSKKVLPVIPFIQTEEAANNARKKGYTYIKKNGTRKKLVLTTGFRQTNVQDEMQKQKPCRRNCKVIRGESKEGN